MNTQLVAEEIKSHLVKLAASFKLPSDLTQLNTKPIERILQKSIDNNFTKDQMATFLSNDLEEHDEIIKILRKELKENPDQMLDFVDGINVWEKVEQSFTVRTFCEQIRLK